MTIELLMLFVSHNLTSGLQHLADKIRISASPLNQVQSVNYYQYTVGIFNGVN